MASLFDHATNNLVIFTANEIHIARRLKTLGLRWEPKAGHYVYDETESCERNSPFQDNVFFILNFDHFMRIAGGLDHFREIMIWLPTWEDLRELLQDLGFSNRDLAEYLSENQSIENRSEREDLYRLLESHLCDESIQLGPKRSRYGP